MVSTPSGLQLLSGTATDTTRDAVDTIWLNGERQRQARQDARRARPLIRLWDGDWNYIATVNGYLEATFQFRLNETGAASVTLPADSWVAKDVLAFHRKNSRNIHVTMDKDGTRWSGRMSAARIEKTNTGERLAVFEFLHDYEELKHILVWPNPALPAMVQFPRAFTLVGPSIWVLKMTLLVNVWRLAGDLWALPDDPLDWRQWGNEFHSTNWPIHVKPNTPIISDSSPWTVISSRMKTWHDVAAPVLADSQLSVETRRYLAGDEPPWEGANIRHGALVVDIVDKSGFWSAEGTATFGDVWKGMVRTVQKVTNHVDTTHSVLDAPSDPPEYHWADFLSTTPNAPYVIYRDGPLTGVETSNFTWEPQTAVQIVNGGHSTYGVNEAISTAVQLVGNMLAGIFSFALQVGSIADEFLKPLYEDTILAWTSLKSIQRAQQQGWSHYYEHFADGADRAYTINSIIALRQGFWETRERVSHKISVRDGAPWFIGQGGQGHFFVGDRIGATVEGLQDGKVAVEQVTEATFSISRSSMEWEITCGDMASQQSPLESVLSRVQRALGAVHDLGVI